MNEPKPTYHALLCAIIAADAHYHMVCEHADEDAKIGQALDRLHEAKRRYTEVTGHKPYKHNGEWV